MRISSKLIWPFRVVVGTVGAGIKQNFMLILNNGGQGNDEPIWEMHGHHREKDILILGTRFRNIFYSGHARALASREMSWGLLYAMPNVETVMRTYATDEEETE